MGNAGDDRVTGEIRALTGLRGVAACYVVVYHMLQDLTGQGLGAVLVRHGYLAVDLFFVLSGFVLAAVHGQDRFDGRGYALFWRKRLARIYPLYLVVTLATLVLIVAEGETPIGPARLLINLALLQGWGAGATIVGPAWSLSAECGAYLVFPLLAALLLEGRPAQALAGAILAWGLLALLCFGGPSPRSGPLDLYQPHGVEPLLRCLGGFTLGLAAYRFGRNATARRWLAAPATGVVLGFAILGLLAWPRSDLAEMILLPFFVAALEATRRGMAARLLAAPVPHALGRLSFSIYLVHFPLRDWLRPALQVHFAGLGLSHAWLLANVATGLATLGLAALAMRLIERPARSMLLGQPLLVRTAP